MIKLLQGVDGVYDKNYQERIKYLMEHCETRKKKKLSRSKNEYENHESLRSIHLIFRAQMGKTGTTQNYSDGWFVGITNLVTTVWTGCEDRSIHFRGCTGYGVTRSFYLYLVNS